MAFKLSLEDPGYLTLHNVRFATIVWYSGWEISTTESTWPMKKYGITLIGISWTIYTYMTNCTSRGRKVELLKDSMKGLFDSGRPTNMIMELIFMIPERRLVPLLGQTEYCGEVVGYVTPSPNFKFLA